MQILNVFYLKSFAKIMLFFLKKKSCKIWWVEKKAVTLHSQTGNVTREQYEI